MVTKGYKRMNQIGHTILLKICKVAKSSTMLLDLLVITTKYKSSIFWYRYRTEEVSIEVCCFADSPKDSLNFGKAANKLSIRDLRIDTNCLATRTKG